MLKYSPSSSYASAMATSGGSLGSLVGPWGVLECPWALLGNPWKVLGALWEGLGGPGGSFRCRWNRSRALGASLGALVTSGEVIGGFLEVPWGSLERPLELSGGLQGGRWETLLISLIFKLLW